MDKYEYKLKLEQLKNLVAEKDYKTAVEIADTINWRKVKSASTLCMVGEIYDRNKRYEDSREILLMAYDRSSVGRNIIYRLALVALKMGNVEEAKEYYDEFLEIAPYDNLRYVLRYEIAKVGGASIGELIDILEEFKEREYTEEWAFELAYLYHRAGNSERCVAVCDELILWFGDGKYVEKALELKMLYQPLNKLQEDKYRQFKLRKEGIVEVRPTDMLESGEIVREPVQIPKVTANTGKFNTVNLQAELAKSMQQIMDASSQETVTDTMDNIKKMVEEIPYLQMPTEKEEDEEEKYGHIESDEEIDGSLKINFKEILAEDRDGQISLFVPDGGNREPQVTGQMSIEDVLSEWERTKRAAEAAMETARKRKLESAKAKALQKAEGIMERLTDVMPKLDAGVSPQELMAEKYLQGTGELPKIELPEDLLQKENVEEELPIEQEEVPEPTINLGEVQQALEQETLQEVEKEEKEESSSEEYLESLLKNEVELPKEEIELAKMEEEPITKLNEEQKEIFSYFVPVTGMEQQLCQVLEGTLHRRENDNTSVAGNIVIMGGRGSGKTVLATDIIKAIQKSGKHAGGKIGKIAASSLNQKDLSKLLKKVAGGYLIIEKAGDLSQETVTKLSLLMEQDTQGLMIIMEDTRVGIDKVLARDANFTRKFTERIKIPVFTSDELVQFAKSYAMEQECEIDDMGILALYNCISNIQKLDEATTLTEVKEIVDIAIDHAERGGLKKLFGGKKYSPEGYLYLREKDFQN
ncbi:tetratricopeptide repeat protein [Roseburia sp. 499]|uniref:tetratricopeptide repeat protein n=1 Tax=Roseburia sp. 499 TaxID=1261634 RepID=UPI000951A628|nr:tetratricopeptide repeat protein [Roseburia sp. 499]WVK69657.1 tetratricopeptide repeat protein [Roseburia sp. 499]